MSANRHFFRSLHKKHFSANTPQVLLPPCSRTEGQVRWKKEHALWMLSRCLQSSLYSQRTLYSCINAFQDAGTWFTARLMDCFPPFPRRVVYILTLVSGEADRSCWIGYLPLPQGHTQQHVCFSSDDFGWFNLYILSEICNVFLSEVYIILLWCTVCVCMMSFYVYTTC